MRLVRRAAPILLLVLIAALFAVGSEVRGWLDVDLSADALPRLRARILELGWKGPALFLALATFRIFLLLPSWLLLTLGGLAFGGLLGAVLGALGTTLSGVLGFSITRAAGRDLVERRIGARARGLEARLRRAGLSIIAVSTAHPAVPMTGFHWVAGLTSLSLAGFTAAVAAGAVLRATSLAFLGSSLVDLGPTASLAILVGLALVGGLPLLHRGFRHWLLGGGDAPEPQPGPPQSTRAASSRRVELD